MDDGNRKSLTGTSVNPARSLGPAIVACIFGNTSTLNMLWIFVFGPLAGAGLAAALYGFLEKPEE
ncbi:MAG: aquaporin [Firmicutes bacterium]|nr:aquaporin [Bacillota bacterium]